MFWPLTDSVGIWHCERSGFTALIGDFDGLSSTEVTAIRAHLATNYNGRSDPVTRLKLLAETYRLRKKDAAFTKQLPFRRRRE